MKPKIIEKLQVRLQEPLPYADQAQQFMTQIPLDRQQQNPRICAVLIVLFPDRQDFTIPFMLRPDDGHVHSGQISFPGGGREKQDKTLVQTALRETKEEIGLSLSESHIIGSLSDIYIIPSNSLVTPYVAFMPEKPKSYQPDPKEVAEIPELHVPDFLNTKNHTSHHVKLANGTKMKFPAYDIDGYHVWGATARIMKELILLWDEIQD